MSARTEEYTLGVEEKNVGDVVETLKMVGEESEALFLLDRELGKRQDEE